VNVVELDGKPLSIPASLQDAIEAGEEQADDADVPRVVHAKDGAVVFAYEMTRHRRSR
jgi:hypothetical protein